MHFLVTLWFIYILHYSGIDINFPLTTIARDQCRFRIGNWNESRFWLNYNISCLLSIERECSTMFFFVCVHLALTMMFLSTAYHRHCHCYSHWFELWWIFRNINAFSPYFSFHLFISSAISSFSSLQVFCRLARNPATNSGSFNEARLVVNICDLFYSHYAFQN